MSEAEEKPAEEQPADAKPAEEQPAEAKPAEAKPPRPTAHQRAQEKREQKLADMQDEIDDGRMTIRQLTPEEMEQHGKRRDEVQAERAARRKR